MEGNPIIDCVLMRLSVEFRSGNRKKVYLSARSLTDTRAATVDLHDGTENSSRTHLWEQINK